MATALEPDPGDLIWTIAEVRLTLPTAPREKAEVEWFLTARGSNAVRVLEADDAAA